MSLDKAIEIAKKIDPNIGPSLDMERKNLPEEQLKAKLRQFFAANKKAAEIILAHPGKSQEEIIHSFDLNLKAHVNNNFHIATFVGNVLNRKGDLAILAGSAAKRIVLSDPRIAAAFQKLKPEEKAARAEKIFDALASGLTSYFENFKGKELDRAAIIEELTTKVTKKIAEILSKF